MAHFLKKCFLSISGEMSIAKELMLAAKRCGADCVKFQKSSLEDKFTQRFNALLLL